MNGEYAKDDIASVLSPELTMKPGHVCVNGAVRDVKPSRDSGLVRTAVEDAPDDFQLSPGELQKLCDGAPLAIRERKSSVRVGMFGIPKKLGHCMFHLGCRAAWIR